MVVGCVIAFGGFLFFFWEFGTSLLLFVGRFLMFFVLFKCFV